MMAKSINMKRLLIRGDSYGNGGGFSGRCSYGTSRSISKLRIVMSMILEVMREAV